MEKVNVVINTAISFLLHSLEQLKTKGYENLSDVVNYVISCKESFLKTYSIEYLYNIISYLTNYKLYGECLSSLFSKFCDLLNTICEWLNNKTSYIYDCIVLKMFEYYYQFLKMHVKKYLKFEELEEIINYIRVEVIEKRNKIDINIELNKRLYDDSIVRILAALLIPTKEHFNSIIEWIDYILVSEKKEESKCSDDNQISEMDLSPIELLKKKRKERKNLSPKMNKCTSEEDIVYIEKMVVVEKEVIETKEEKLRRILAKYSIKNKNMDKSPPMNESNNQKVLRDRENL